MIGADKKNPKEISKNGELERRRLTFRPKV
jgi:hypothetical protein